MWPPKNRDRPHFHHLAAAVLALAVSTIAVAQSAKVYRIGVLETTPASSNRVNFDAFLRGMRDHGYVEGKNLVIDYRSSDGQGERFSELTANLVRAKPDVIVVRGTPAALAAKKAGSIPVVMVAGANPIGTGVVPNLSRPGGNVTGLSSIVTEVLAKRMELIKELVPGIKRIGLVLNPANPNSPIQAKEFQRGGQRLGIEGRTFEASDPEGLRKAFAAAANQGVGALLINAEGLFYANRQLIAEVAAKHRLPVIYASREFVEAGGLLSYGVHYADLYYRAAGYVDKILKGANPGDLPIEQPSKLELVVNLKTAQALGIHFSREFLARTDEAIQ